MAHRNEKYRRIIAVTETIRVLNSVPSGTLYTALMAQCPDITLGEYRSILDFAIRAKLVEERSHVLRWIGCDFRLAKNGEVE